MQMIEVEYKNEVKRFAPEEVRAGVRLSTVVGQRLLQPRASVGAYA
jgi:hypothetical protein